jgi:hypothetical protein
MPIMSRKNSKQAKKALKLALENYDELDTRGSLVDLVTDIKHACDLKQIDFYELLDSAHAHYSAERTDTAAKMLGL